MKFADIDINSIQKNGFDKILIIRNNEIFLGGTLKNILVYKDIIKEKTVLKQFGDEDTWVIEIE